MVPYKNGQSREDIVEEIVLLQKRIWQLRRLLQDRSDGDEALRAQEQCSHVSKILVDSGPRDNGELTFRCLQCGAIL